jgi:hypothetical protein
LMTTPSLVMVTVVASTLVPAVQVAGWNRIQIGRRGPVGSGIAVFTEKTGDDDGNADGGRFIGGAFRGFGNAESRFRWLNRFYG